MGSILHIPVAGRKIAAADYHAEHLFDLDPADIQAALGYTPADAATHATDAELAAGLATKAASVHTHDDRYYTEAEVNALLAGLGGTGIYEVAPVKPLASQYTLENPGTASFADGAYGVILTMPSSTVNVRFLRRNAGLPGATWTITMRASMVTPFITTNIHHCCIILRNSVNGRLISFGQSGATTPVATWSSYTAFNAMIANLGTMTGLLPGWHRVTYDGTTLRFWMSSNGVDWAEYTSTLSATYLGTPDQIGIGSINGAASSVTNADIFESVQYS